MLKAASTEYDTCGSVHPRTTSRSEQAALCSIGRHSAVPKSAETLMGTYVSMNMGKVKI